MMILKSSFLFLLSAVATTQAFVPPARTLWKTPSTIPGLASKLSNEEALARLQHEYKVLQEQLLLDLVVKHDEEDAERIEEQMIEIATKATQLQEQKQLELLEEAERSQAKAQRYSKMGQDLNQEAHDGARKDAFVVKEMEAAYDDLVRYSSYKELEAINKKEAAQLLLSELQENEKRLQATLETMKHEKEVHKKKTLEEDLHSQHRSFLDTVKDAIYAHPDILISLDPHIL